LAVFKGARTHTHTLLPFFLDFFLLLTEGGANPSEPHACKATSKLKKLFDVAILFFSKCVADEKALAHTHRASERE